MNNKVHLYPASLKTKDGTKWGFINDQGEFAIQPIYDYAYDFQSNGLATVQLDRYGCINSNGQFVIKPIFESIIDFSEGRATVVYNGGYQVINECGDILTKGSFSFISPYQDGRAVVSDTINGQYRYGYLNLNGNVVIELKFEGANDFQNGVAVVKLMENLYDLIDKFGNTIQSFLYYFVGSYGDGLLAFQKSANSHYGYINKEGQIVISPRFGNALPFENGRAVVNASSDYQNKFGFIDKSGKYIIEPIYNDIMTLGENRLAIGIALNKEKPYLGSKYAIWNWNGQPLTDFIFDHISSFDQGIASVVSNNKAYFVDRSGNRVRGLPMVEGADSVTMVGNVIRALKGARFAYFLRNGKLIWKQNTIIPLSNRYRIIEKKYEPNRNYLVYYPHLDGLKSNHVETEVNKTLQKLSNLKKVSQEEQLDYQYTGDFNVEFFKKNLLVLELHGYEYFFGAAHGMPNKTYPNINLISGQFYSLKDLFKKDSNYVKVISDIIEKMINTDPQYNYVFPDAYKGIAPDQPFYVSEKSLFIYFNPYEIGPYAAGFPTFKIPFHDIKEIINEKGEFWLSFH